MIVIFHWAVTLAKYKNMFGLETQIVKLFLKKIIILFFFLNCKFVNGCGKTAYR